MAVETLAAALARYPDEPQLEEAIDGARQALEVKRRETGIENACRAAASLLERQDFQSALARIDDAIQEFGADTRLTGYQTRISAAEAAHERETAIQKALASSQRSLAGGDPDAALQQLLETARSYPDDERIVSAADAARKALELQRLNAQIDAVCRSASENVERGEFDAALEDLARGIATHGEDARLADLQKTTALAKADWERCRRVGAAMQHAEAVLGQGDPQASVKILEAALVEDAGEPQLLQALSAARQAQYAKERSAAVEKVRKEVRRCIKSHQFDRALATLRQELEVYAADADLVKLENDVRSAQAEWEREQRRSAGPVASRRIAGQQPGR